MDGSIDVNVKADDSSTFHSLAHPKHVYETCYAAPNDIGSETTERLKCVPNRKATPTNSSQGIISPSAGVSER